MHFSMDSRTTIRKSTTLIASLVALALVFSLLSDVGRAAIVASDGFDYTVGSQLGGNNGGTGWAGAWSSVASVTVQNASPPLSVNPAVRLTQNNSNAAYRSLGSSFAGNEVFVGFTFQFNSGSITNNDFMGLWFDNAATGDHTSVPNIGLKAELGPGGTDYFVRVTGTGGSWSQAVQAQIGQTVEIVGRLWKSGASATFNNYSLWINPDYNALGAPDVTATGAGSLSQFGIVGIRTVNLSGSDALFIDDLRLGTTWGDVVVPEPAALVIWLVLGMGSWLGLRIARRRRLPTGRQPWSPENRRAIHELIARGTQQQG